MSTFKIIWAEEPIDVEAANMPALRALVTELFPGIDAADAIQLHFNRKDPTPTNPQGTGVTARLLRVKSITEQELKDSIAAGNPPTVHAVEDE